MKLALTLIGFTPVTLIAISAFGVFGLRDLATHVLVPAVLLAIFLTGRHRWASTLVSCAAVVGVMATGAYDAVRFGFIWADLMHVDPIPHIGVALHLTPPWVFGYLWRYAGNGAGLALAFGCLGFRTLRAGLLFGLFVCGGLLTVLALSPLGERILFPLNGTTVIMATVGHLVYGAGLVGFRRITDRSAAAHGRSSRGL